MTSAGLSVIPGRGTASNPEFEIRSVLRTIPERQWFGDCPLTPIEIEKIFRDEAGRALATLIGLLGDFDLAEDALQDAFAVALERWPSADLPSNPRAWLVSVGRNKAIDRDSPQDRLPRQAAGADARTAAECVGAVRNRRQCARRRHVAADLYLLPSVVCCGSSGRADAAHGVRAHHGSRLRAPFSPAKTRWRSACCAPSRKSVSPASPTRCRSAKRWSRGCAACSQ